MPSFNPFTSVTGRHSYTLFEIRLENDFIVFRGSDHESSGQYIKGTVVLCLPTPLKVEDVHLRLNGILHLSWTDTKITPSGISNQKVDKTSIIYEHKWQPFVGVGAPGASSASGGIGSSSSTTLTKGITLPAGNYEWPFELMLPGDTTETVEGLPEASITYKLKATVARGKLAYDYHAYKRVRVIRTLESSALEFLHAMSVENIWPNKVEYSIVIPQKAVVFGSAIPLETRFTPLLKGLELGDITIRLIEVHELMLQSTSGHTVKEYKKEREVAMWTLPMSREEHWQDLIEDTGQEGWVMNTTLDLPRKLGRCLQDVNSQGIKIRHKLKMVVALKNPDGHISELRATLPVTIFISPNMPLDEDGNLVRQMPNGAPENATRTMNSIAPPGYGEHVLDQLYEDMDTTTTGMQTPAVLSGMNSPFYGHSRAGSSENLAALANSTAITPAALQSRLQSMTLDPSHRNTSWNSLHGGTASSGHVTPHPDHHHHHGPQMSHSASHSAPASAPLSRQVSDERESGTNTPEHVDFPELSVLSKVPSYKTAVRTPARQLSYTDTMALPDYQTALTAPGTPSADAHSVDPLSTIMEAPREVRSREPSPVRHRPSLGWRRQTSMGFHSHSHGHHHPQTGEGDERRRSHLLQVRDRVV